MERIKKAIEKVKQGKQANLPGNQGTVIDPPIRSDTVMRSQASLVNHTYTQTQVKELDHAQLEHNRIVAYNKNNSLSAPFDILRTRVLEKMAENGWRTLAITSPTPEAGKTMVAINLAMSVSRLNEKTAMLVDFDLRSPKIADYMGLELDKSLNDIFDEQASIDEVLVNPCIPRLVILAASKPITNSSELLSSSNAHKMVQDLRSRYEERIVIFDLPPLLNTADAIAILPKMDCVILVVADGMNSKQEISDCIRRLPAKNLLGVVLNKASENMKHNYY